MEYNFICSKEFESGQICIADAKTTINDNNLFDPNNAFFNLREQDNYSFKCYTHTDENNKIVDLSIVLNDPNAEVKISSDGKSHCFKRYNYVLIKNGKVGIFDRYNKDSGFFCDVENGLYSVYVMKTRDDIIQAIELRKD